MSISRHLVYGIASWCHPGQCKRRKIMRAEWRNQIRERIKVLIEEIWY